MPSYGKVTPAVVKELEAIVGAANLSTRLEELICYSRDSTIYVYSPDVVVRPAATEQVSSILKLANSLRIPVTPRGAGTSCAGSPLPVAGGILLDMAGMNRVLSVDLDNQMVVVEPGVVCDDLNEQLMKQGFFFPPDPASSPACTIGGMVNTNAAGNRTIKYGSTRDFVLWLEVVLANGDVITTGSKTLKSASGYDLTRLIVGSEGSLGVVTKVGLKVIPVPESYATGLLLYDSVKDLAMAATKIRRSGVIPEMLEFMDEKTTQAAFEYAGVKGLPKGNFLLVDCGGSKTDAAASLERCLQICQERNPSHVEKALDPEYRLKLIAARKAALPALARLRPSTIIEDCTVAPTSIPEAAAKVAGLPSRIAVEGFDMGNFGHIGDGNMHPTFIFDERVQEQRDAFQKALDILYYEIVLPMGGSVTGEHGIGIVRTKYIQDEHGPAVQVMRSIKQLLDPNLILNPGKGKGGPILPEAS
ncbi:MAG: FAD-linked oxidase C-terminal domain-containing protein [Candidatus Bathyarchaeia archaeon]